MKSRFNKTAILNRTSILAVAVSSALFTASISAAPTATPATTSASIPQGPMTAFVEEVHGNVRVRTTPDDPWKPAAVNMQLPEGAEIQTSMHSSVRCSIPPDQFFVLDRATKLRIGQAIADGGKIRTDLQMKYGRTQFQIEAAGLEHQATISSPGSTLAIRGTNVALENTAPFDPVATSYTGRARFFTNNRQISVGSAGGSRVVTDAAARDAADAALVASVIDPKFSGARTDAENKLIANEQARGATFGFDTTTNIPIIVNGPGPIKNEQQLIQSLPGRLDFVARWTGNVDVNLEIFTEHGDPVHLLQTVFASQHPFTPDEFLYPGYNLNHTITGGTTAFDDRGGPHGGQEIAFWTNNVPHGVYSIIAFDVTGKKTPIEINGYLDGKRISLYDFSAATPRTTDYKATLPLVFPPVNIPLPDGTTLHIPGSTSDFAQLLAFIPAVPSLESMPDASNPSTAANTPAAPPTLNAKQAKQIKAFFSKPSASTAKPTVTRTVRGK
jgi:hypothetical protein